MNEDNIFHVHMSINYIHEFHAAIAIAGLLLRIGLAKFQQLNIFKFVSAKT